MRRVILHFPGNILHSASMSLLPENSLEQCWFYVSHYLRFPFMDTSATEYPAGEQLFGLIRDPHFQRIRAETKDRKRIL